MIECIETCEHMQSVFPTIRAEEKTAASKETARKRTLVYAPCSARCSTHGFRNTGTEYKKTHRACAKKNNKREEPICFGSFSIYRNIQNINEFRNIS